MIIPVSENWLPVVGCRGYEVSDLGNVRSYRSSNGRGELKDQPRPLKPSTMGDKPYLQVTLGYGNGTFRQVQVQLLVLEAFVGPRPSPLHDGCHNNGIGHDNHLSNLRWDTKSGNMEDKILHGTAQRGERHGNAVLTDDQVRQIKEALPNWKRGMGLEFAEKFGVGTSTISRVKREQSWTHV